MTRPNESFEGRRKSRDCWSSGWGADSYEETVRAREQNHKNLKSHQNRPVENKKVNQTELNHDT